MAMRRVSLAVMVGALALVAAPNRDSEPVVARHPDDLRVLSMNICGWVCNWSTGRPTPIAEDSAGLIREHTPDVVAVQEVCAAQLDAMLKALADAGFSYEGHHFETFDLGDGCRFGNALLWDGDVHVGGAASWPLPRQARRGSDEVIDEPRVLGCIYGDDTLFCVAHLVPDYRAVPPWPDAYGTLRDLQVRELVTAVTGARTKRGVVLAGDFNAPDDAPELARIPHSLRVVVTDTRCECVDHVYVDRDRYEVTSTARLRLRGSDHRALLVNLRQ